jgi:hypothetical protein
MANQPNDGRQLRGDFFEMITTLTITSPSFAGYTTRQLPRIMEPDTRLILLTVDEPKDNQFGQRGFNRVCWQKARAIRGTLNEMTDDHWLLYMDADVILFSSPTQIINEAQGLHHNGAEIVAQHDPDTGACAGFMAIKNTETMRHLFRVLCQNERPDLNDQLVLNAILKQGGIPHSFFSAEKVGSFGNLHGGIWQGEDFAVPRGLMAFHLNYCVGIENKHSLAAYVMGQVAK